MTAQEAKEILLRYRPGTADREDPEVAAALELAQDDPELARWFEEHRAVQAAIRDKFSRIEVPEGLKEQILSERKAHTTLVLRRRVALVAAATAVLFLLVQTAPFLRHPADDLSLSAFRTRMAGKVLREYPNMDLETNDLHQIRQFLAGKHAHGDSTLPPALEKTVPTGCATLTWHEKPVAMICFNSGKKADPKAADLFLFVIDRAAVGNPPATNSAQVARISRKLATASWSAGGKVFVLAGLGDEAFVRNYLGYQ
jgi:hypothetical protein